MWSNRVLFFLFSFCLLFSCKTSKLVKIGNFSNISDVKLRNKLIDNELIYNKLYLKKVQFSFHEGDKESSFKGSFVIQKDSFIIVSINALMGIELVRAKLTPNEVIIIDKHDKKVVLTNYGFFAQKYGIDFNFNSIQSLLTNSLFLYPVEDDYYKGLEKYKHQVNDGYYSFKSVKDKKLGRLNRKSRNDIVVHDIDIYPDIFRIFKVFIKDFSSNQTLVVDYKEFRLFDKVLFPGIISIRGEKGLKSIHVDLNINYLEIDDGGSTHFKVPSSYSVKNM